MSEEEGGECPLTHCLGCLSLLYQFLTTAQSDKQLQVGRREGGRGRGRRRERGEEECCRRDERG